VTRTQLIVGGALAGLVLLTVVLVFEALNVSATAQIVGYQHTGDPRKIVVIVAIGQLDEIAERQVQEDATSVRVTVRKRTGSGTASGALTVVPVTVTLRDALRDRTVRDDKGAAVRDRGTYELPEPTGVP
jgi:hypothetical protein